MYRHSYPRAALRRTTALVLAVVSCVEVQAAAPSDNRAIVSADVHHDVLPSLSAMVRSAKSGGDRGTSHAVKMPRPYTGVPSAAVVDRATQASPRVSLAAPTASAGLNFDGLGQGFPGFTVNSAPPDTNGAVGATQYFQIVNSSCAIFDKATGARLLGAAATNTIWAGFGGKCQTANDGDAAVKWDQAAQRWIVSQFAVTPNAAPFLECVAVSQTADATGAYYRYAFSYNNFPDYPKFSVWPDAYYFTFNQFNAAGTAFLGPLACAYDRAKMLIGAPATQQCFSLTTAFDSLLPADPDGNSPVPAGAPNYLMNIGPTALNMWKFHVDFTTPANTTFTGPTAIPVAAYTQLCSAKGSCIRQPGTNTRLDSLGDRLMFRLAYRQYPDGHEAMVATHSVSTGLRWYEVRSPASAPVMFQQGTYVPNSATRWLGSAGQDKLGNFAIGYSVSSTAIRPSLRYSLRAPADPLGTLGSETTIITGTGVQTGGLSRWGDYAAMVVDPVDDCTFWFTSEYLKTNGSFNWNTRIASFKIPACQ